MIVDVDPDNAAITAGTTQQFTATTTIGPVTWSTDGGSIDGSGLYTAPLVLPVSLIAQTNAPYSNRIQLTFGAVYHVTATSVVDPTVSDTVPIIVNTVGAFTQNGPLGAFNAARDLEIYVDGVPLLVQTSYFDARFSRYLLFMGSTIDLQGVIQVIHHMPSPPFTSAIPVSPPIPVTMSGFALLASFSTLGDPD